MKYSSEGYPVYTCAEYGLSKESPYLHQHVFGRTLNSIKHCHEFYEFYVFFKGGCTQVIDDRVYANNAGTALIIKPGEAHIVASQTDEFDMHALSIYPDEMRGFLRAYGLDEDYPDGCDRLVHFSNHQSHSLQTLLRHLVAPLRPFNTEKCRIISGKLIHEYMLAGTGMKDEWYTTVYEKMSHPEMLAQGVSALLTITNLSHAQLCRNIKKELDITPQQYIKDMRLDYAFNMILGIDKSLEDVAADVGYMSYSHFCTSFKQRFEMSPADLRKKSHLYRI